MDHKNSEEAALVRRVQARDELAFREIVERYQAKVFSIIYGILRNHNDAEDIAQQVFSKVYFSIRNFDFRSSLLTWIYKITVNECYDYLRKKRVRKLVYESDFSEEDASRMEASDPAIDPATPMDRKLAQRDLVTKLLDKVSAEDRSLILLKEVEGHSVEELGGDDRPEREYNKGKAVPDTPEAAQSGPAVKPDAAVREVRTTAGIKTREFRCNDDLREEYHASLDSGSPGTGPGGAGEQSSCCRAFDGM